MDPETASIRSEAPSYISSSAPPPHYSSQGVPPPYTVSSAASARYSSLIPPENDTGGHHRRLHPLPNATDVVNAGPSAYLTGISPARRAMQSAQYQRVAARRAKKTQQLQQCNDQSSRWYARTQSFAAGNTLDSMPEKTNNNKPTQRRRGYSEPSIGDTYGIYDEEVEEEDKHDAEDDMEAALAKESREWDFMLAQMKDWDDREKRWNRFKENQLQTGWKGLAKGLRRG